MRRSLIVAALHVPLTVIGTVLFAGGIFALGALEPFLGLGIIAATFGVVAISSLKLSDRVLPLPIVWCMVAVVTASMSGVWLGRRCFARVLLEEITRLESQLGGTSTPIGAAPTSWLFRGVHVSRDAAGATTVVFGLRDGTVVEYFADAGRWMREARKPCTRELRPGWYHRWRCAQENRK
jgi:hypothetical protein